MYVSIETTCPICKKSTSIQVPNDDFMNWQFNDVLIQDAFPYLDDSEREMLITGICKQCYDNIIKCYDNIKNDKN